MYKIFLDTNALLDYYFGRKPGGEGCMRIINSSEGGSHALYTSSLCLKDLFYLIGNTLKRTARERSGTLSESQAKAASDTAWSCIKHALSLMEITNAGREECLRAFTYRPLRDDFEDDLMLAAACSVDADFVVTSDEKLIRHAPIACLAPLDLAQLLEAEAKR